MTVYYRGGNSLVARRREVRLDPVTGSVLSKRGVSVSTKPDGLDRFGGAFQLTSIPAGLTFLQIGPNLDHYEVVPVQPVPFAEYQRLLDQITLIPE